MVVISQDSALSTSTTRPEAAKTCFTSGSANNAFFSEPTTPRTGGVTVDAISEQAV